MNIQEFQRESEKIVRLNDKKLGSTHDANMALIHLMEEIGEISRIIYNMKTKRYHNTKNELEGEISDAIIFLAYIASLHEIDLDESVGKKLAELRRRFQL